eukprot:127039-Pelagomonas_calceolata.AAC.1
MSQSLFYVCTAPFLFIHLASQKRAFLSGKKSIQHPKGCILYVHSATKEANTRHARLRVSHPQQSTHESKCCMSSK